MESLLPLLSDSTLPSHFHRAASTVVFFFSLIYFGVLWSQPNSQSRVETVEVGSSSCFKQALSKLLFLFFLIFVICLEVMWKKLYSWAKQLCLKPFTTDFRKVIIVSLFQCRASRWTDCEFENGFQRTQSRGQMGKQHWDETASAKRNFLFTLPTNCYQWPYLCSNQEHIWLGLGRINRGLPVSPALFTT